MRLLTTKFFVPPPRPEWLARPHLVQHLNDALSARLILLSAPPGFGKTTLLSLWAGGIRSTQRPVSQRVAWLSLDPEDDDPARFWSYSIAAVRTARPNAGATLVETLQSPVERGLQPVVALDMLAELLNDIAADPQPLIFILDDYHAITQPAIHAGVQFLIENLPPSMHVVVASRTDPPWPLALWRARGHVAEVRANELRLTPQEAAAFLNDVMRLRLSAQDVAALEERTEGWIAGLQMAALSMRGREDHAAFVRAFGGSNRMVLDYLVEEVLDRQPPDVRAFLLRTSILERLCSPLCDAVLGDVVGERQDSQHMLARLDHDNLFLVALDDERRWYRYHHLFADLLKERLAQVCPSEVALLHRRAAGWLSANGCAVEAITHALAAQDYEHAADLIEQMLAAVAWRGEAPLVRCWIKELPEDLIRARPILCIGNAYTQQRPDDVERWLQAAEEVADRAPHGVPLGGPEPQFRDMLALEIAAIRLDLARWRGEPAERLIEAAHRALAMAPAGQPSLSAGLHQQLAHDYLRLGQEETAEREYTAAATLAAGNNVALAMQAVYDRSSIHMNRGRLRRTAAIYREARETIIAPAEAAGRRVPAAGAVYIGLVRVLLEWNELDEADRFLERGLELIAATQGQSIFVSGCIALSRLRGAQGRFSEAHAALEKALPVCTWDPLLIPAMRAHLWVVESATNPGMLDAAMQWADDQYLATITKPSPSLHGVARVRIAQRRAGGHNDLAPVMALLDDALQRAEAAGHLAWIVDLLALASLALQADGQEQGALDALRQAIERGEPERFTRTIIQHGAPMRALLRRLAAQAGGAQAGAERLLHELDRVAAPLTLLSDAGAPAAASPLVEPLSDREREVLRLLAGTLSSTAIAAHLVISPNTVRTHIKSIYAKLEVHRRPAALAKARALKFL